MAHKIMLQKAAAFVSIIVMSAGILHLDDTHANRVQSTLPTPITSDREATVPSRTVVQQINTVYDQSISTKNFDYASNTLNISTRGLQNRYSNAESINAYFIHLDLSARIGTAGTTRGGDGTRGENSTAVSNYSLYEVIGDDSNSQSFLVTIAINGSTLTAKGYRKLYANKTTGKLRYYADNNILLKKVSMNPYTTIFGNALPDEMFTSVHSYTTKYGEKRELKMVQPVYAYTFGWNPNVITNELTNSREGDGETTFYMIPNPAGYATVSEAINGLSRSGLSRGGWTILAVGNSGILVGQKPTISLPIKYGLWEILKSTLKVQ